ncbi:valine n-monooxygenase 1 [Quercus suber]|uniref:Valine n-monooxygenase 1 n=1 Tax=Quercus suber TaxID=58331 RepID=A0AAW0JII5_QUESU
MEWPMTKLLKQPPLIKKATKELDRVIGRERWVEEKDIPQLPYIEAIVKETMRKHPVVGLLVPRLALEDCDCMNFTYQEGGDAYNIFDISST